MKITTALPSHAPQTFDLHRCRAGAGAKTALLCLNADDAAFVDAAFDSLAPGSGGDEGAACWLDRRLWEASLSQTDDSPSRAAIYSAGIAAVQAFCLRTHGRRFQQLARPARSAVLATLRNGGGFGGISVFQCLASMLAADAAEANFASERT